MTETWYQNFSDAIDIVAVHNGDKRLTRQQSAGLKQAREREKLRSNNEHFSLRFNPPPHEEVQRAFATLGAGFLALMTVANAVHGSYPAKRPDESYEDFFKRLQNQARTNEDFWKSGLLLAAIFKPPVWITGSLAQDHGCQIGPGHVKDAHNVPNSRRVHIEAQFRFEGEEAKNYVIYPQATQRLEGPLEIGKIGRLARETIKYAGWMVLDGWVTSSKPSRPMFTRTPEAESGGSDPKPKLG